MISEEVNITPYTQEFSSLLNTKIVVLCTGDDIVCDGITEENY